MERARLVELRDLNRDGLLNDTIPFWQSRIIDQEHGGYLHYRDGDGSLLSSDKAVWVQGRIAWMWSRLCNDIEKRAEWLEVARHGVDFMLEHAFDDDGRMFYIVTRDGRPVRKRRYLFTETFGVVALAEYGRAAGEPGMVRRARELYDLILRYHTTPGLLEPKVIPATRQLKGHAMPMILMATSQVLRQSDPDGAADYNRVIDAAIEEVLRDFLKPEKKCLLETVLADGAILDTPEGRTVNPGHAIESAWFMLAEARHRGGDRGLVEQACRIIEWSLEIGWDEAHGGILYFVDCDGKPPEQYEHDMKLWWPHNESLYALLLAHHLTGDAKWSDWYERVHAWSYDHFPDREHGEWYGYLHRDGTISSTVKSNHWKGPFHLPRMQLYSWKLLDEMIGDGTEARRH